MDDLMAVQMLANRAGVGFLRDLASLVEAHPHPNGPALRVSVTVIASGEQLGEVDVDTTNLWDIGNLAARRAASPIEAETPARRLRVIRGEAS
ncbi:hypothetical protein [Streptomyces sp. NPDC003857]